MSTWADLPAAAAPRLKQYLSNKHGLTLTDQQALDFATNIADFADQFAQDEREAAVALVQEQATATIQSERETARQFIKNARRFVRRFVEDQLPCVTMGGTCIQHHKALPCPVQEARTWLDTLAPEA